MSADDSPTSPRADTAASSPGAAPGTAAPAAGGQTGPKPARITVHRTSDQDARQRQVYMSLDDAQIATLLYGQRMTREIAPGHHRLRANNTLVWKTVEFDAVPGADLHFTLVNRAAPGMLWMVALLGSGPMFVSLEPSSAPDSRA